MLVRAGDADATLLLVVEGRLQLAPPGSPSLAKAEVEAGDCVGEVGPATRLAADTDVVAATPCTLLTIDRERLAAPVRPTGRGTPLARLNREFRLQIYFTVAACSDTWRD